MAVAQTNSQGVKAVLRNCHMSASKVRVVLNLIRNQEISKASDTLDLCERDAAEVVRKLLFSAVANAENNNGMDPEELFVSACFADESATSKRWRPRARGRASRIRKRNCHITVIVDRLPADRLERIHRRKSVDESTRRARRLRSGSKRVPRRQRNQPEVSEIENEELNPTPIEESSQIPADQSPSLEQSQVIEQQGQSQTDAETGRETE